MKNKIFAVIAVLALAFAGLAFIEGSDDAATTSGTVTAPAALDVGRTAQVVFTYTGAAPLDGQTVTWAQTGGTSVDFSSATSTTDALGKAYVTITGTAAGSVSITAKIGTDDPVSSSTVTVSALSTKQIGSWGVVAASDFNATASSVDDPSLASRMYAFQYTDDTLMVYTGYMQNMSKVANVYVKLTDSTDKTTVIGPYPAQERIYADLKGFIIDGSVTKVQLLNYDGSVALSGELSLTMYKTTTASFSKLALVPQYHTTAEGNHTSAAVTYENLVRNEKFTLSKEVSVQLVRSGYDLAGWSYDKAATSTDASGDMNGNGHVDVPIETMSVEDILMMGAQAWPAGGSASSYTVPTVQTSNTFTLYGVWIKQYFTIEYVDPAAVEYDEPDTFAVDASNSTVIAGAVADISGSTVIEGSPSSYGIVSIVKRDVSKDHEYIYTLRFMTEAGTDAALGSYQYEMVNNGTWKVYNVSQNLKISAIATITNALETGVDFAVNYLRNSSTGQNGEARLALDLLDYPATAGQSIYLKGTYYRELSDVNVRVYGNIENLNVLGDGVTLNDMSNEERHYEAYIDKQKQTTTYTGASNEVALYESGQLDNGVLTTTAGGHSYDLTMVTHDDSGFYIYGIQGVWDTDGTAANAGMIYYTPWAIYEDDSYDESP